jgi:hypothetical protein
MLKGWNYIQPYSDCEDCELSSLTICSTSVSNAEDYLYKANAWHPFPRVVCSTKLQISYGLGKGRETNGYQENPKP